MSEGLLTWGQASSQAATTGSPGVNADTYALWRMDESTMGAYYTLRDVGALGAHMSGGTVANTPRVCPGPVVGKRARQVGSVTYNGLTNNANPGALANTFQGTYTIEAYVYLDQLAAGCVYSYGAPGETQATNVQAGLWVTAGGKLQTKWESGVGVDRITTQVAGGALAAGQWYHVAVRKGYVAGSVEFFINGVLQDTVAYAANADGGTSAYHYGFGHELGASPWLGRIAGLKISAYGVADAVLLADYNAMSTTGLMAYDGTTACYWSCDDPADADDSAGRIPLCANSSIADLWVSSPLANPKGFARYLNASTATLKQLQANGGPPTAVPPWVTSLLTVLRGDWSIDLWVSPINGAARGLFYVVGTAGGYPARNYFSWSIGSGAPPAWTATVAFQYGAVPTVDTFTTGTLFSQTDVIRGRGVHLCVTKTANVYRHYVNGVLMHTSAARNPYDGTGSVDTSLTIGADSGGNTFSGALDEMRLTSRALTAAEVLALYKAGANGGAIAFRPH